MVVEVVERVVRLVSGYHSCALLFLDPRSLMTPPHHTLSDVLYHPVEP